MSVENGQPPGIQRPPHIPRGRLFSECSKQTMSVFPTFLILTSCSFHYSWTIVRSYYVDEVHMVLSWFIGGIIGAVVAAFLTYKLPNRILCRISGGLALVSGILLVVSNELGVIIAARYISGIAFGLAFLPGVIHAAEIADRRFRGAACSIVSLGMITALFIGSILFIASDDMILLHGIFCIIFAVGGLITSWWLIESPTYHLMRNNDAQAEENLKMLRKVPVSTPELLLELEDTRSLIRESNILSSLPLADGYTKPLVAVSLLRIVFAFSLSIPIVVQLAVWFAAVETGKWSLFIIVFLRFLFEILNTVYIDSWGHFVMLNRSLVPSGIMLLILISVLEATGYIATLKFLVICITLYQMLSGMGLGTSSTTYLAQSFPIAKKTWSILAIFTIEMLVHILANCVHTVGNYFSVQFFVVSALAIVVGFATCYLLPDTTQVALGESQMRMRGSR